MEEHRERFLRQILILVKNVLRRGSLISVTNWFIKRYGFAENFTPERLKTENDLFYARGWGSPYKISAR